jgi:hypothetical protein
MDPKRILPFEIKTTQFSQALLYLWIPLLLSLPIFVSKEIRIIPYLISILMMLVVFLSFFLAAQTFLSTEIRAEKEERSTGLLKEALLEDDDESIHEV